MSYNLINGTSTPNTTEDMAKLIKDAMVTTSKKVFAEQTAQCTNLESADTTVKKHKRSKKKTGYAVKNEVLLYKLSDAGLLSKLHGVHGTAPRTWYFDRDNDVKEIIDQFNAENKVSFSIDKDGKVNLYRGTVAMDAVGLTIDESGMHFLHNAERIENAGALMSINDEKMKNDKTPNAPFETISMRVHNETEMPFTSKNIETMATANAQTLEKLVHCTEVGAEMPEASVEMEELFSTINDVNTQLVKLKSVTDSAKNLEKMAHWMETGVEKANELSQYLQKCVDSGDALKYDNVENGGKGIILKVNDVGNATQEITVLDTAEAGKKTKKQKVQYKTIKMRVRKN